MNGPDSRAKKTGRLTVADPLQLRDPGRVLCLAALYESFLVHPAGGDLGGATGRVLGVLLATLMRGYANDVYFQVGLITIIGLSARTPF